MESLHAEREPYFAPRANRIDEHQWIQAVANNPAFDFLKEPEEDSYTLADGKPFHD